MMEFWNRLIGNNPTGPPAHQQAQIPSPDSRLSDFKRSWLTLQHAWRNGPPNDPNLQHTLRNPIRRLTDLLIEEENQPVRMCYNYAYDQQIFIPVSRIAQTGSSIVITAVIRFFSTLIDDEENEFLSAPNFAQSLTDFLERTARRADPSYETQFVEFLFSLATKIRQNPDTLPLWFAKRADRHQSLEKNASERFAGATNKEDFPLFYLLLDYVHHDGRVGDFARTGLLYIIESASSSKALETWVVESDLATIMASGLGALYSQLSRKLVIAYSEDDIPAAVRFSDYRPERSNFGAVRSDSLEFRTHLDTFLSYMAFWQDVLEHCRSTEVRQTLLDHFKVLFIQQLLYPSLLESSDADGGSSVAVLTYLRVILEQLDSVDMTHILLSYLLSLPTESTTPSTTDSPSVLKRKESLDMLSQIVDAESTPTPDLYSLVDLILTGLGSKSQPTVACTLRLVSAMIRKFHPYVTVSVLKTTPVVASPKSRTLGMLNYELEVLSSFASRISDDDDDDPTYETYLGDMGVLVETHPCSAHALAAKLNQRNVTPSMHEAAPHIKEHIVRPDDPVLLACVRLLESFFGNTVETNLMLTSLLIDMASCCNVSLEKWLLMDASMYQAAQSPNPAGAEDEDEEEDTFISEDSGNPFGAPIDVGDDSDDEEEYISAQLRRPAAGDRRRDTLLPDAARHAFRFSESLNDALSKNSSGGLQPGSSPRRPSKVRAGGGSEFSSPRRPASPAVNAAHLTPSKLGGAGAGTGTPRGRQATGGGGGGHARNLSGKEIYNEQTMKPLPSLPSLPSEGDVAGYAVETASETGQSVVSAEGEEQQISTMTMSHLLTNIVILQEFLKELSALLQIRSSLYNDITFATAP
ncbi:hypothetical protein DRE_03749 [Drechslerella stenobrocha 248]|uniref:Retinoic acid induced 16-like protein-domain-containing protein n=1 Tax=Drechslerella stenobrocha 248 TaxID=1043628 RepID=W7I3M8_9PEZI|nr:hypothetical protein DRE_03749 [Drechslerella stenobrocha 248]